MPHSDAPRAPGGELRIVAHFPQGDVVINRFEDIPKRETPAQDLVKS